MARTALTTVASADTGATVTMSAANADGHFIDGGKACLLLVTNGGVGSINVTIQTPRTVNGLAVADQVVAVANGSTKVIGPFDPATYDRPTGTDEGKVYVDFSGVSEIAHVTPVPGGVGPMTRAMLLRNTLLAAERILGGGHR